MRVRGSSGRVIDLRGATVLGVGGEARVFDFGDPSLVAKVYHKPSEERGRKLQVMLANPPGDPMAAQGHTSIAWPVEILRTTDAAQRVIGFVMARATGMHVIIDLYNPVARRRLCPLFNYYYLHRTARNLAAAGSALHARGYVIGDVKETNVLAGDTALVTIVDTDSFQVRDVHGGAIYRCLVYTPEFTPPELQGKDLSRTDRSTEHDCFGLAVLIFRLLMEGTHPFDGVFQGGGDPPPYEERIKAGWFPYGLKLRAPFLPKPMSPSIDLLHPGIRRLFMQCFEDGHRDPGARPDAGTWQAALKEAEDALVTCAANDQHRYGGHLSSCPWCERTARLNGRDPFPSQQAVQRGQHTPPSLQRQTPLPRIGFHRPPPAPPRPTPLATRPTRWWGVAIAPVLVLFAYLANRSSGLPASPPKQAATERELMARIDKLEKDQAVLRAAQPQTGPRAAQVPQVDLNKVYEIPVDDSAVRGSKNAPVTVAMFSDFQCPFCQQAIGIVDEMLKQYPTNIKFVMKQFPLRQIHPNAEPAAEAAIAAGKQGKFWEMHDELYKNGRNLTPETIKGIAVKIGLDMKKFEADRQSTEVKKQIDAELALGQKVDVRGTPSIFVNGKVLQNRSVEGMKAQIDEELKKKG